MTHDTANRIDLLIHDSGLFPLRDKVLTNMSSFDFSEDVILITGAAGSIGSGLTRQLMTCKFKKLILIDNAESPFYDLIKSLEFIEHSNVEFNLLNITDEDSIKHLFETTKPSIVFHTAAYKHVPLMEKNAKRAVETNILGTKLLADLSVKHKVGKFIFISTDKAVNPINVMGITKKISEDYLRFLNRQNDTNFITTRFGNIFGSNGSVVTLFKRQIEFGQPITITNNTISRYFISKTKACHLILKLASLTHYSNHAFTFDMGAPIKISDIVERLIRRCNKADNPPEIKYIGLRPGEKLNEDIVSEHEILLETEHEDILIIKSKKDSKFKTIDFNRLSSIKPSVSNSEIKTILLNYI